MDVAKLGLQVDSSQVKRATGDLDRFTRTGRQVEGSAQRMGRSIGRAIAAFGGIALSGATLGRFVRTVGDFETSMSKVAAISGATDAELARLRDTAKELGATTRFSASQAADGLGFLAMAGFSATEAITAIPGVLDMAAAGGLELARAADIASNVLSGFGMEADEAARVSDVLAKAAASSNTNIEQLGGAMSYAAPAAAAIGEELEMTAAAIGVLSDAGIQGQRAGVAVANVMSRMVSPTKAARSALADLGLTAADVNVEQHGLQAVMDTLAASGIGLAEANELVGVEMGKALLVMIEGADKMAVYDETLRNAEGSARQMAATMSDNLQGDLLAMNSAIEGLIISVGDTGATGGLRSVVQGITDLIRAASEWEYLDKVVMALGGIAVAAAAVMFPVAAAAAALTVGAIYIASHWEDLNQRFPAIMGGITSAMEGARAYVADEWAPAMEEAGTGGMTGIESSIQAVKAALEGDWPLAWDNAKIAFQGFVDFVQNINPINRLASRISANVAEIARDLATGVANWTVSMRASIAIWSAETWATIKAKLEEWSQKAIAKGEGVVDGINQGIENATAAVKDAVSGIWTTIETTVAGWTDGLIQTGRDLIQGFIDGILEKTATITEVVTAPISTAVSAVKKLLKIQSPSKIMHDLGGYTMEGFADGVNAMAGGVVESIVNAMEGAIGASEKLASSLSGQLSSAIDGVADAFWKFLESGFTDFKSFATSVVKTFWDMLKSMITMAAKNRIMLSLGIGGATGGAATASPLGSIGNLAGSATGGSKGILGGLLGSFGTATTAGSGILGGLGSTISAIGTNGLGALFTPAANVAAAGITGFGATLGAALPIIGAAAAVIFGIFKFIGAMKKTFKEVSEAVKLTGHNLDEVAGLGWGAASNLKKLAGSIDELNKLTQSFYENFYSEAEKIARNRGEVRDVFADLGRAIPSSTASFKDLVEAQDLGTKEGRETYIELLKVADAFKKVQDAADQLAQGVTKIVDAVSVLRPIGSGQFMLEEFARLAETDFGSVDNFASAVGNAYSVLTTDSRKVADAQSLLDETFKELGLSIPGTRNGFLKLLTAQNLMSKSGQETFSTLIGVVGAFDQVTPRMADFTEALTTLSGELTTGLQSAITAAGNAADQFIDLFRDLRDAASDIRADATGPGAQAGNAMDDFRRAYALAMAGDFDAMRSIGALGSKAVESAAAIASDATEYRLFASRVASQIDNVSGLAAGLGVMKTIEEQTLEEILKLVESGELTTDLLDENIARIATMNDSFLAALMSTGSATVEGLGSTASDIVAGLGATSDQIAVDLGALGATLGAGLSDHASNILGGLGGTSSAIVDSLGGVGSGIITELGGMGGSLLSTLANLNVDTVLSLHALNEGIKASISNSDIPIVSAIWASTADVISALQMVGEAVNNINKQKEIADLADSAAAKSAKRQASAAPASVPESVKKNPTTVTSQPAYNYWDAVTSGAGQWGPSGFATGGLHLGGARIVGESGPELEVTGPSRIYSNTQTRSMFDMNGLIAEVRELRRQIAEADDTKINGLARISKNTKSTKDVLEDWDGNGLPAERT
jgi:TP901 family phage tail tape measure protein